MSMISDLVDRLRVESKSMGKYGTDYMATLLMQASDTIVMLSEKARADRPQAKWIPCSERLPEKEEKSYWVCTDDGYQCQCRWTNVNHFWTYLTTEWHWHIVDVPQYSKVVAWMPLPKVWEGEEDD